MKRPVGLVAVVLLGAACQPTADPESGEAVARECDTAVAVDYALGPQGAAGEVTVESARVTGLSPACHSAGLRVTVGDGTVDLEVGGPVAIAGTTATVTFADPPPARSIRRVGIAIGNDGPPPALCAAQQYARRLVGGNGPNTIAGDARREVVFGFGVGDTLRGGGADDCLVGGAGADVIEGGSGADRIDGGPGRDTCRGQAGQDLFRDCEVVQQ